MKSLFAICLLSVAAIADEPTPHYRYSVELLPVTERTETQRLVITRSGMLDITSELPATATQHEFVAGPVGTTVTLTLRYVSATGLESAAATTSFVVTAPTVDTPPAAPAGFGAITQVGPAEIPTDPSVHDFTGLPMTADGWTDFTAMCQHADFYLDSRIVYVSSSGGNDGTAVNYTPASPEVGSDPFAVTGGVMAYATIAVAYDQLRDGYPDIMLLKRGDVWSAILGSGGRWKKTGRSSLERMIVASYGDDLHRPVLQPEENALSVLGGGGTPARMSFLCFADFEIYAAHKDPDSPTFQPSNQSGAGISWLRDGEDILFEGMKVRFTGMAIQTIASRFVLRRCTIEHSYSLNSHAQGIYSDYVNGLLIEDCVFHHNGWHESIPGAEPTIFNHNLYINSLTRDVVVRNCIIADASANGLQLRPGGVMHNNLFLRNPIAGYISGSGGSITRNVVLSSRNLSATAPYGWGLTAQNSGVAVVHENIVAHQTNNVDAGFAYSMSTQVPDNFTDGRLQAVNFERNIAHKWGGTALTITSGSEFVERISLSQNVFQQYHPNHRLTVLANHDPEKYQFTENRYFAADNADTWFDLNTVVLGHDQWVQTTSETGSVIGEASFPDPERTIETYDAMLGGSGTYESFIGRAAEQSRWNWNPAYTADAVNSYVRAGFGVGE